MIPELAELIRERVAGFETLRLFDYVTVRAILAALFAFLITIIFGRRVIVWLFKNRYRDVSEDVLTADASSKRGTPTMGGVLLLGAATMAYLLFGRLGSEFGWLGLSSFLYFGVIGLIDDIQKVRAGRSRGGMSERAKWLAQLAYAVVFAFIYLHPSYSPFPAGFAGQVFVPFIKVPIGEIGWYYGIFAVFVILAITNAVNITDGLDGLAIFPAISTAAVYAVFAYIIGNKVQAEYLRFEFIPGTEELTVLCSAIAGAGLGFLWFNAYPAEVFMGDTGALALGGVLSTTALLLKQELLFVLVGGVFVVEVGSSLIQGKIGENIAGRRLLYRAPLHLSFRHLGVAEPRVVIRFWIISIILALAGLLTLKVR
jgi:phospho-N-acetylmuramoyl-pentapeptide-transferase